ncbi:MAG: hypothetical protein K0B09_03530 [Bacteroidales bacterium]|nr:hypothetical protein [Bacteroidales bacterium]
MTENKIKENLDNPRELERLYRRDKKAFEAAFQQILPEMEGQPLAEFWKARLAEEKDKDLFSGIKRYDILALLVSAAMAGLLIKLPALFGFDPDATHFIQRNAIWTAFFGLSLYTILSLKRFNIRKLMYTGVAFLIPVVYMNLLPVLPFSHTINLAYVHLPLLMWAIFGMVYMNWDFSSKIKRIEYIKYNGELAVLGAIILIAGGALTGITIGLFEVIDIKIENFYMNYIAMTGLVAAPILTAFIVRFFPAISSKVPPIIARIFSPLVLITLLVYLVAMAVSGKNPYQDRDFLIIFNLLLVGVMALIVFSVSEAASGSKQRFNEMTLLLLSVITLLVNLIALSAIVYRLGEYGFTPNRTAVLGSNLLIFIHLAWIMVDLFKVNFRKAGIKKVENTIAAYLPVYAAWTIIVIFVFPIIFGWWVVE